jgi:hypothetical protein
MLERQEYKEKKRGLQLNETTKKRPSEALKLGRF